MTTRMLDRRSRSVVVVWIVLVASIALSVLLGADNASSAASAAIVIVAFTKVWLIGNYFMELNRATRLLQWAFAAYVVLTCAMLILAFYRWW